MAPLPQSVEEEARQDRVKHSLELVAGATFSVGRSKLYVAAATSLEETTPEEVGAEKLTEEYSEARIIQAKAAMKETADTFPMEQG